MFNNNVSQSCDILANKLDKHFIIEENHFHEKYINKNNNTTQEKIITCRH